MNFIQFVAIVVASGAILISAENGGGFGYELIVRALEAMQNSLDSLAAKVDRIEEKQLEMAANVETLKGSQTEMASRVDRMEVKQSEMAANVETLKGSQTEISAKVDRMEEKQSEVAANVDHLKESHRKLETLFNDHNTTTVAEIQQISCVIGKECKCPQDESNGTYLLKVPGSYPFEVHCENGWIVIHRRLNGSVNFNLPWAPYRDGFGDLRGEHWLGLENMHRITRTGSYELMVILKSFAGVEKTAKYETFKIDSESDGYRLEVGKFAGGDAEDDLSDHNGQKFSTSDRDNDKRLYSSCADLYSSGWWFNYCGSTNLNGIYREGTGRCLFWFSFNLGEECLKEARMMIRARE